MAFAKLFPRAMLPPTQSPQLTTLNGAWPGAPFLNLIRPIKKCAYSLTSPRSLSGNLQSFQLSQLYPPRPSPKAHAQ